MFGLSTPYLALAGMLALLGAYIGGELHGRAARDDHYGRIIAEQTAEAATTLAAETAKAAAADALNAELANKLDTQHAKALADIDATRADFSGRLRLAASRACRGGPAATEAADPGSGAGTAAGGDDGPGSLDLEAGGRLRDYLRQLQAYAVSCHAFAMEIGR